MTERFYGVVILNFLTAVFFLRVKTKSNKTDAAFNNNNNNNNNSNNNNNNNNNNLLLIVRLLHWEMLTGALQYPKKNYKIERNLIYLSYKLLLYIKLIKLIYKNLFTKGGLYASKLTERAVFCQIHDHLTINRLYPIVNITVQKLPCCESKTISYSI